MQLSSSIFHIKSSSNQLGFRCTLICFNPGYDSFQQFGVKLPSIGWPAPLTMQSSSLPLWRWGAWQETRSCLNNGGVHQKLLHRQCANESGCASKCFSSVDAELADEVGDQDPQNTVRRALPLLLGLANILSCRSAQVWSRLYPVSARTPRSQSPLQHFSWNWWSFTVLAWGDTSI